MSVEQILIVIIIIEFLIIFFLGLELKSCQKAVKLYSDMYIESAGILSDLVVKDELVMDFDGDFSENMPKTAK